MGSILATTLMGMISKIVTKAVIEQLVVLGLEKLVASTKSKADDRLLQIVKEGLNRK